MKGSICRAGYLLTGIACVMMLVGCPTPPPATDVVVTVTPDSADLEVGQTITLDAESTDTADTTFAWTSSDPAVVTVEQADGVSTTIRGVAAGTATITATGSNSDEAGEAVITVPSEEEPPTTIPPALLAGGLDVAITGVTIPADLKPEVTFTAKNTKGQTLAKSEISTLRFILAYLDAPVDSAAAKFASYTRSANGQATYDSAQLNGLTQLADGSFKYKFAKAVPANYPATAVHELGAQIARLYVIDGLTYPANPIYSFVPSSGKAVAALGRDIIKTETCNKCHTRLEFHGGQRREMQLCILCHQPQSIDPETGNSVDMTEMIHKIHMGAQLPSVVAGGEYQIIGHNNTPYNYSEIVFSQRIANCTACHDQAGETQGNAWRTNPTIANCGSCHDRTWFGDPDATPAGYTNHPYDFEQVDSAECDTCHTSGNTGVSPIGPAHAALTEPGMLMDILQVTPNAVTGALSIQFKMTHLDGTPITDATAPERVGVLLAWPASDYQNQVSETMGGARPITGTLLSPTSETGVYDYTFLATLPTGTTDTFAVALTGRWAADDDGEIVEQGTSSNGLTFFTLDGSTPTPRRDVVSNEACNACHNEIRFHGEQRFGVEVCVMCHRPNLSEDGETFNFKEMIHYLHTGAKLENDYLGGAFDNVNFPGKREQCTMCHLPEAFLTPLPEDAVATTITLPDTSTVTVPATRAACTSCHDSTAADTHAFVNSNAQGVESCAVCHGENARDDVVDVHAMLP